MKRKLKAIVKRKMSEKTRLKRIARLNPELSRDIAEELSKPKEQEYQGTVAPSYTPTQVGEQYAPTTNAYLSTE